MNNVIKIADNTPETLDEQLLVNLQRRSQYRTMQILVKRITFHIHLTIKRQLYVNIVTTSKPEVVVSLDLFVVCFVCEISSD